MIPALALMLILQASPATQKAPLPDISSYFDGCNTVTCTKGQYGEFCTSTLMACGNYPEITFNPQIELFHPQAPPAPNFTVTPCDITSLAGDCGYLFQPTEWPVIIGDFHVVPDQPLAKSMADQGWSCTYDEIHIECVAPPKRRAR